MPESGERRIEEIRRFLSGGVQTRPFVRLDPSSYAAIFAGKPGGQPTVEDMVAFHRAFPNDAMPAVVPDYGAAVPELRWSRKRLREEAGGAVIWEETLTLPGGEKRRLVADEPGTIQWLMEPAVRSAEDFDLIDFYADRIRENVGAMAEAMAKYPPLFRELDMLPGVVILSAFEVYWLIDYPDMAVFYLDWPERYLETIGKIHAANLALLDALSAVGFEIFYTGSAGLELLSPRIFHEAIVPVQREFNDHTAALGRFSSYHICGHSRQLIEDGVIDDLKPTVFETCSTPPCGNNKSLHDAVHGISEEIVTKGNLSLELLRNGTPDQIAEAVGRIAEATRDRRHIIGQADATILTGTPPENIHAFVRTAMRG